MQKFSILSLRKFLGGVVIIYQVIKTTDSPEILLFFICGYLLLGIIFLVIGVCIGHHYRKQRRKDIVTVPAKVVKVEMKTVSTSQNGDYNTVQSMSYFPVFRYDYAGRIQEVESNFGQTANVYTMQDKMLRFTLTVKPESFVGVRLMTRQRKLFLQYLLLLDASCCH